MCLDLVTMKIRALPEPFKPSKYLRKKIIPGTVFAWKDMYIRQRDGKTYFYHSIYSEKHPKGLLAGRWYKAIETPNVGHRERGLYTSGFHGYAGNADGKRIKVIFRGVHTIGYQDGETVFVAREMMIPMATLDAQ